MTRTALTLAAVGLAVTWTNSSAMKPVDEPEPPRRPVVQMAILLDTSGSMQGLIEQAKAQLWSVVSDLATARRGELRPELQVALYEYGKGSLSAENGYIRMILPLTNDLDKVSEELFALTVGGSLEYCGWVIQSATNELAWSPDRKDLKMIFIAGNEPFTQGPVDYRESVPAAIAKGIIVNTIYCGDRVEGIRGEWESGAKLADGEFLHIDIGAHAPQIASPQDVKLSELNLALNATYIPFGAAGAEGQWRQREQDANSQQTGASTQAQRAASKASELYFCSWDLCDAVRSKQVKLADVKAEDLPEVMRPMTLAQREAYVQKHIDDRVKIQSQIAVLAKERDAHVAAERRRLALAGVNTLDTALLTCVRTQGATKGFVFESVDPK